MRILIIGSGGREHALAYKLAQSPQVEKLYIAPGNGGTAELAESVQLAPDKISELARFAKEQRIDLVVPGPELPLTLGITDAMAKEGIACFGPDQYCAQLEGSKSFAKEIMNKAGVPTATCRVFKDAASAKAYVERVPGQVVVKADGLAAGKGVVVANDKAGAMAAIEEMLNQKQFGQAGETILVEERLNGEEVSLLCLCDGERAVPLPSAQDHKAAYDEDEGPNTGGMGAYSPAPILPDTDLEKMADLVARPVLAELAKRGHPFKGVLYAGLMLTNAGPKVLEYNVRFGDPECEPLMLRLQSDLASHLLACCHGTLKEEKINFTPEAAVGVVLAADGYPGSYARGMPITNLDAAEEQATVFHAGTSRKDGLLTANGGRVLCVTALGADLGEARHKAYNAIGKINMPQGRYRKDIACKGLARLHSLS